MSRCESCGLWSRPGEQVHAVGCMNPIPCPSCKALRDLNDELKKAWAKEVLEVNALREELARRDMKDRESYRCTDCGAWHLKPVEERKCEFCGQLLHERDGHFCVVKNEWR